MLEVIQLQDRTVDEVVPLLRPLVGEEGAVTGMNDQLIVRTTPENLEQIRDVLRRIDRAPRQLLITVKQGTRTDISEDSAAFSGRLRPEDRTRLSIPDRGTGGLSVERRSGRSAIRGRVDILRTQSDDENIQQVRVIEGREALIQIGKSVPVTDYTDTFDDVEGQVLTEYLDVTTGFTVVARVNGDRVRLDISPWRENLSAAGSGDVQVQRLHTTVTGRLGQWLDIGGSGQGLSERESGIVYRITTHVEDRHRVLLKVEEVR
jgi:hypothetical protein